MSGHFQNDGVVQTSLDVWRYLAIEWIENTIAVEFGENGQSNGTYRIPIYVPCEKITLKQHDGMWNPSKKRKRVKQKYQKQSCHKYSKCGK